MNRTGHSHLNAGRLSNWRKLPHASSRSSRGPLPEARQDPCRRLSAHRFWHPCRSIKGVGQPTSRAPPFLILASTDFESMPDSRSCACASRIMLPSAAAPAPTASAPVNNERFVTSNRPCIVILLELLRQNQPESWDVVLTAARNSEFGLKMNVGVIRYSGDREEKREIRQSNRGENLDWLVPLIDDLQPLIQQVGNSDD